MRKKQNEKGKREMGVQEPRRFGLQDQMREAVRVHSRAKTEIQIWINYLSGLVAKFT